MQNTRRLQQALQNGEKPELHTLAERRQAIFTEPKRRASRRHRAPVSIKETKPWDAPATAQFVSKMSCKTLADCRATYEMAPREHLEQKSHDTRVEIDYFAPREFYHPYNSVKQSVVFKAKSGFVKNTELTFAQWESYFGSDQEESD